MLNQTQRSTLRGAIKVAVDTILESNVPQAAEWLQRCVNPISLSIEEVRTVLSENLETIVTLLRTTNIPEQIADDWRQFASLLHRNEIVPNELLARLRNNNANYDPFCIAEMQRFTKSVNDMDPATCSHLIRLRETYLEMTPMHDYRYGERYRTFRFRIGEVPFNLNNFGPKPTKNEIQTDTKEYVEERLELHSNYQQQTEAAIDQRNRATQQTLDALFAAQLQIQEVEHKHRQSPPTQLFHTAATAALSRDSKSQAQLIQQLARQFEVTENSIWLTEITEQTLVAMAGVYTPQQGKARFRRHDQQTTYFILQFSNRDEIEQFMTHYQRQYPNFISHSEILENNRCKINVNTSVLYHQITAALGNFHKNSHRNLMERFADQMQVDISEVTHGIAVEQRLVELSGIDTKQTNAQFRRNTCYATDFKLHFADKEEFNQFVEYYQQHTPQLILNATYQADTLSTISMDTLKLYTFAAELTPAAHSPVCG